MNRRSLLTSALLALAARRLPLPAWAGTAAAQEQATKPAWRHGISLFGDLKYPADFKHFEYVNPDAPKGGRLVESMLGTFDSLNPLIVRGGSPA